MADDTPMPTTPASNGHATALAEASDHAAVARAATTVDDRRAARKRMVASLASMQVITKAPMQTFGVSGTPEAGGYLYTKESNAELIGTQEFVTYSNMLANDDLIATGVRFFLDLIAKIGWAVEATHDPDAPKDEVTEYELHAERVKDALFEMPLTPWHKTVRRSALYRFYGFSIQEWTMMRHEDGYFTFLEMATRPQSTIETWNLDPHGRLLSVGQRAPKDGRLIPIPIGKCFYLYDDALDDSPKGMGILRHVVKKSRGLSRLEQLEGFAFETDLTGIPIGYAPIAELKQALADGDITQKEYDNALLPMSTLIQNHIRGVETGAMFDSSVYESMDDAATPSASRQWLLELLRGGGGEGMIAIAKAIERKQREIARILGIEHMLLGSSNRGSFAMSRDKTRNFAQLVDSVLKDIAREVKTQLIERLYLVNGWDRKYMPKIKTAAVQHRAIEEITQALVDLSVAGAPITPEDPVVNEIREELGLSDMPAPIANELVAALLDPSTPTTAPGIQSGTRPRPDGPTTETDPA